MSQRTAIRDRVIAALKSHVTQEVYPHWIDVDQCKGYPTLCVVVTDETYEQTVMKGLEVEGMLRIIGYAKHDKDPRGALDTLIEDHFAAFAREEDAIRGESLYHLAPTETTTDDGTKIAAPFAQFVTTWRFKFSRRFGFSG